MNRLVPKVVTSVDTLYSIEVGMVALLKTDNANVTQKVIRPNAVVTNHFLDLGQFIGFSASLDPPHSKKLGSFVGTFS